MKWTKKELLDLIEEAYKKESSIRYNWNEIPDESFALFDRFERKEDIFNLPINISKGVLFQALVVYKQIDANHFWELIEQCKKDNARLDRYEGEDADSLIVMSLNTIPYNTFKDAIGLDVLPYLSLKDILLLFQDKNRESIIKNMRMYFDKVAIKTRIPALNGDFSVFSDDFINGLLKNVCQNEKIEWSSLYAQIKIQLLKELKESVDKIDTPLQEVCFQRGLYLIRSRTEVKHAEWLTNEQIDGFSRYAYNISPEFYYNARSIVDNGGFSKEEFQRAMQLAQNYRYAIALFNMKETIVFLNSPDFNDIPEKIRLSCSVSNLKEIVELKNKIPNPDFYDIAVSILNNGIDNLTGALLPGILENAFLFFSKEDSDIVSTGSITRLVTLQELSDEKEKKAIIRNYKRFLKSKFENKKTVTDDIGTKLSVEELRKVFSDEVLEKIGFHALMFSNLHTVANLELADISKYKELAELACVKGTTGFGDLKFEEHSELLQDELFKKYKDILIFGKLGTTSKILSCGNEECIENYKKILLKLEKQLNVKENYEDPEEFEFLLKALRTETRTKLESRMKELGLSKATILENCLKRVDISFIGRIVDNDKLLDNFLKLVDKCIKIGAEKLSITDPSILSDEVFERFGGDLLIQGGEDIIKKVSEYSPEDAALFVEISQKAIKDKKQLHNISSLTPDMIRTLGYDYVVRMSPNDTEELSKLSAEERKQVLIRYKKVLDDLGEESGSYYSIYVMDLLQKPELLEKVQSAIDRHKDTSCIKSVVQVLKTISVKDIEHLVKEQDYDRLIDLCDRQEKTKFRHGISITEVAYDKPIKSFGECFSYFLDENLDTEKQVELSQKLVAKDTLYAKPQQLLNFGDDVEVKAEISLQLSDISELSIEQLEQLKSRFNITEIGINDEAEKNNPLAERAPYSIEEYIEVKKAMNKLLDGIEHTGGDPSKEYDTFMRVYRRVIEIQYNKEALLVNPADKIVNTCRNMYDGLVEGKCVCAGYADILRNALSCVGIKARSIAGIGLFGNESGHAWNQVQINGKWYNVDATWDSVNKTDLRYCLKNDEDFANHEEFMYRPGRQVACTGYASIDVKAEPQIKPESIRAASSAQGIDVGMLNYARHVVEHTVKNPEIQQDTVEGEGDTVEP